MVTSFCQKMSHWFLKEWNCPPPLAGGLVKNCVLPANWELLWPCGADLHLGQHEGDGGCGDHLQQAQGPAACSRRCADLLHCEWGSMHRFADRLCVPLPAAQTAGARAWSAECGGVGNGR